MPCPPRDLDRTGVHRRHSRPCDRPTDSDGKGSVGQERFDLREMPFDRYNFRSEALNLADEGVVAVEIQQTFLHLSHPTKFLLSAYQDDKIRHGNHPVLNWMASCLQFQYDHKDNCQPSKPERGRTSKRIDGISAIVTALSRALVAQDTSQVGVRAVG